MAGGKSAKREVDRASRSAHERVNNQITINLLPLEEVDENGKFWSSTALGRKNWQQVMLVCCLIWLVS